MTLKNELPQATTIHWHGLHVPNAMDGVPPFTQPPIEPGQSFTYEFPASHAGTFMYHWHLNSVEQIDRTCVWHCHELHHTENDGVEPGGLIQAIRYEGAAPPNTSAAPTSEDAAPATPIQMPGNMPGIRH